jgi:predicted kinase
LARLIFICGHSGAGKTTISRSLVRRLNELTRENYFLLDKDTAYSKYSSKVMGLLTGDPDDRDSEVFLRELREPEYNGMLDITRENLDIGVNVVVCAPFSVEVKSRRIFDARALGVAADTAISVIWVTVPEQVARERIERRGERRDRYKLEHWDEYRRRRFEPAAGDYPGLLFYDNTIYSESRTLEIVKAIVFPEPAPAQP